jgi:hypothetical protein
LEIPQALARGLTNCQRYHSRRAAGNVLHEGINTMGVGVFGVATAAFGLVTLFWHDYTFQLSEMWSAQGGHVLVYATAAAQICGGAAMLFHRTANKGAVVSGAVYLVFALMCVPPIVASPQTYDGWGNFFEQFSLVTGAAIVYGRLSSTWARDTRQRIGRVLMGLCFASFAVVQALHLDATARLVPTWLPASQMFWAEATTVAFAVAAVALLTNRMALLATRLVTMMIVSFGLLVWVRLVVADPHNQTNWGEGVETFAIAGAAWILADVLGEAPLSATASSSSTP